MFKNDLRKLKRMAKNVACEIIYLLTLLSSAFEKGRMKIIEYLVFIMDMWDPWRYLDPHTALA